MEKVIAVVVTYNRKELLQECLDALLRQTSNLEKILVINNCSTDGTELLFEKNAKYDNKKIDFYTTKKNLGGAGGFAEGFKIAEQYTYDWLWIMDDDSIVYENALEELLNANKKILDKNKEQKVSFLASTVYGPNNEPMNVPKISIKYTENGYSNWYFNLEDGLIPINEATFVSLLINGKAIKEVGNPIADYFIWGDDTEYTRRLVNNYGEAFFCGKSKVLHKRFNAKKISIINEDNKNRINMYSYYYRNSLLNSRKFDGKAKTFLRCCYYIFFSYVNLFKKGNTNRFKKFCVIQKGVFNYLFKSGKIKSNKN